MSRDVLVAGVGMIPFTKPGANEPYPQMAAKATRIALADAGIGYELLQQAYVGYVYGDSTAGQRAVYEVGMTGIPIVNVNNNCSTGSTALYLARQAVASGSADCVLALGFEQMSPGALGSVFKDRPSPFDRYDEATAELVGHGEIPLALRYFGGAGLAHMQQYGTQLSTFAKIRAKASRHASNNPLALFRTVLSEDDVMNAPVMWPGVMTRSMACPPTCGAAAAIICSDEFAKRHGLDRRVRIKAQAMTTDGPRTFGAGDMREVVGFTMAQTAARQVYESAGIGPGRHRRRRAARLLRPQRVDQLRSAGPVPGRRRRKNSSSTATTLTAARWSPILPAACSARVIRLVPPALPSAPSWSSNCAARPTSARSTARGWPCSTTSDWVVPVW